MRRRCRLRLVGQAALAAAAAILAFTFTPTFDGSMSSMPAPQEHLATEIETPPVEVQTQKTVVAGANVGEAPRESANARLVAEISSHPFSGPEPVFILAPSENGTRHHCRRRWARGAQITGDVLGHDQGPLLVASRGAIETVSDKTIPIVLNLRP